MLKEKNFSFTFLGWGAGFLIFLLLLLTYLGEAGIRGLNERGKVSSPAVAGFSSSVSTDNLSPAEAKMVRSFLLFKRIKDNFIPRGVPPVYGAELGISFDRAQESINKVRLLAPTYGQKGKKIELTAAEKERYIKIGQQIACRYCCSARTLVDSTGRPACGCAHSIMMRGLLAYLLRNYPQWSDEQILAELQKWQRVFFPKQTLGQELARQKQAGVEGLEDFFQSFPGFLPQMVGGC